MDDINLKKAPTDVTIIEGFPGFGLIGTIATEFLISHLNCEEIGFHWFEDVAATVAIHNNRIIKPMNIYYCEEKNLVIIHAITLGKKLEWPIADYINKLAEKLNAREIISLEGVASVSSEYPKAYFITNNESKKEHLKSLELEELKEGVIVGVTSALMLKAVKPLIAFFAETHTELPDSNAAAKIIEILSRYLQLNLDPEPLREQAAMFEEKIKSMLSQTEKINSDIEKKQMSYVG